MSRRKLAGRLLPLFFALIASVARAHDARPVSIDISERGAGLYLVRMRVPPSVEADNQPRIIWPESCRVLQGSGLLQCASSLEGQKLEIRYPLFNPSLSTLFRMRGATRVLPPDEQTWIVPRDLARHEIALSYLELGIRHIWTGIDHLLFVAGLVILARTKRRVVLAITGFTLAHSLTLSGAVLGFVRVPIPPVEAAIALSILLLAREIARPEPYGLARRFPVAVSTSFGLLHGFGFAAALQDAGLPARELPLGLLCFNLGVEIGQLAFIAALLAIIFSVRRLNGFSAEPGAPRFATALAGHALGIPAAFWLMERLSLF